MQSHFKKKNLKVTGGAIFIFFYFQTGLGAEEALKITTNSIFFKKENMIYPNITNQLWDLNKKVNP